MIERHLVAAVIGAFLMINNGRANGDDVTKTRTYPKAPRSDTIDDYHGTKVADPFRPLKDPDAPATQTWVEADDQVTFRLDPHRDQGRPRRRQADQQAH